MLRDKLKEMREASQKTLKEVASEIGVSKPYYWQIENGKRRLSYELAVRIARVFGKKPDDIFLSNELTNGELRGGISKEVI